MPVYKLNVANRDFAIVHPHIPKTGGTAVVKFFKRKLGAEIFFDTENHAIRPIMRCPPQHYHYEILSTIFHLEKASYSFAIVRNPLDRIKSDYHWSLTRSTLKNHIKSISFDDWVKMVFVQYEKNPYYLANHIRPQHHFIGPEIREVFQYEDGLETIISKVLSRIGVKIEGEFKLERVNTRPENNAKYGTFDKIEVGVETHQKILEFYREDFENFGYETKFN